MNLKNLYINKYWNKKVQGFFRRFFLICSSFFTILFYASQSYSEVPNATAKLSSTSPVGTTSQMASLIGGLVLIIVLIYGLAWFVKRFSQGGFLQNSAIKIVASLQLGTRERLALIQVGDKQILLGISATQINCLHTFDEPVVLPSEKNNMVTSEFSQKLMSILQGKSLLDTKTFVGTHGEPEPASVVTPKKRSTKKNIKE